MKHVGYPVCVVQTLFRRVICFFKQKAAYEMRISDWSSDVCSSDLGRGGGVAQEAGQSAERGRGGLQQFRRQLRGRSEERRVGKECVSTCRSRRSRDHEKKIDTISIKPFIIKDNYFLHTTIV